MKFETFDDSVVTLDTYNSDLNLVIDASRYSAHPLTNEGFAFMWAGARATHGVSKGKICFEVKVTKNIDVSHLPADEPNPHVVRVGFSVENSPLQLGEDPLSYGYGGTGKISTNCQFKNYGTSFGENDVIMGLLNMDSNPIEMGFAKNGEFLGWAYKVNKKELGGQALFPHILTKNCDFEVNFGQLDQPYFKCPPGYVSYKFIGCIPPDQREHGTKGPSRREDCEIIMMCGLPGCGKSYWAEEYAKKNPQKKYNVLGTNNIIDKMKVMGLPRKRNYHGRWDVLIQMATKCLNKSFEIGSKLNRNYILDQTNVYYTAQRRKMRNFEGFHRSAIVIVPTPEEFKRRCDKRDQEEGKEIPDHAVLEMKANFKIPTVGDIFEKVTFPELQYEEAEKLVKTYNEEGKANTNPSKRFKPNEPSPVGRNTSGFNRGGQNTGFGGRPPLNQGGDFGSARNARGGRGGFDGPKRGGFDGFGRGDDKGFDSGFRSGGERGFDSGYGPGGDSGGFGRGGGNMGDMDKRSGRGGGRGSGFDSGFRGRGGRGGFPNRGDDNKDDRFSARGNFEGGFQGRGSVGDDAQHRSVSPIYGGDNGLGGRRAYRGTPASFYEAVYDSNRYAGFGNDRGFQGAGGRGGRGAGNNRGMGGSGGRGGGRGSSERGGRGGSGSNRGFGSEGFGRGGGYDSSGQSGFGRKPESGSYGNSEEFNKSGYGRPPQGGYNKDEGRYGGSYNEGYDTGNTYGGGYNKDSGYGKPESGSGGYVKSEYASSASSERYSGDAGYSSEYSSEYKDSGYSSSRASYNTESSYGSRAGRGDINAGPSRSNPPHGSTGSRNWPSNSQQSRSQSDYQGGQGSYGKPSGASSTSGSSGYGSYDSKYSAGYGTQGYPQYGCESKGGGGTTDKSWGSDASANAAPSQGTSGTSMSQNQWSQWSQPPPPPPPPQQHYGQSGAAPGSSAYGGGSSMYGSSSYGSSSTYGVNSYSTK